MASGDGAVLFADLAGFSALTEAHGDERAVGAVVRFVELTELAMSEGSRLVKTIGDAVMIFGPDCRAGVDTALELMRIVDEEPAFPGVRIGLHVGPVIERDGDVFGATVNIAARFAEHAHVGQLVTSRVPAAHVAKHTDAPVRSLGPTRLKNVGEEIELFAIEGSHERPLAQALDPVCRMYVDADAAPARLPWRDRSWIFCSFECASAFAADPVRFAEQAAPG
jgi:class 3 adenylate cyclase/YHS domain-containing protein